MTGPALFDRYRSLPDVPDELVDAAGGMRPGWSILIDQLAALSAAEIAAAFALGRQYLDNSGVFYRRYRDEAGPARDWPISPLPVILPETEWRGIEAGLIQRAELLEQVCADLYGDNRLVSDGHLPAQLIAASPEWLRPMVGTQPVGGHFLHFIAFEIGRGPDGRWWVLEDRTDAPSGAGFALENRIATTKVFPDLYRNANVHRLAGFFGAFRAALDTLRLSVGAQTGILTPGPMADTYDEHAYIARYLGIPLLEGEDMIVENGRLKMRTIDGPVPVDVLWRRMDGVWADPLELREESQLGTPGLLSAIRQGNVAVVNALGAGVLETQALMAFLPKVSRVLTGQELALPNVATWWCGQQKELDHVRTHADKMMIGPALATRMPYETDAVHAIGGTLRGTDETGLLDWLGDNAARLVAKEMVTLSTTPVYEDGALVPRPMTLRVFLARGPAGWQVMPGGFARIGATDDPEAVAMRHGGSVADVWILSDAPVATHSLGAPSASDFHRAHPGSLPSQAADNLFWVGRYVERMEGLLRLVRAYHGRLQESASDPLLTTIADYLDTFGVIAAEPFPKGLQDMLSAAIESASQIRDRFNIDGWAALMDMEKSILRIADGVQPGADAASFMSVMLRKIAGFSGLIHENMYRTAGWQFLTLGRSLERAANMAGLLIAVADPAAPEGGLDLAIEVGDSVIVHRQRYAVFTTRENVVDLLALDGTNPRSIMFHLNVAAERIRDLCLQHSDRRADLVLGRVQELQRDYGNLGITALDTPALMDVQARILALSGDLSATFME